MSSSSHPKKSTSSSSATKSKSSSALSSTSSSSHAHSSAKVVALPSMTHSLSHLPTMPSVDPRCLHYGGLGASKEASQAKLQQTLQRRDPASTTYGGRSSSHHGQATPYSAPSRTGNGGDDGDYLMMNNKGRKKPA